MLAGLEASIRWPEAVELRHEAARDGTIAMQAKTARFVAYFKSARPGRVDPALDLKRSKKRSGNT